MLTTLLWRAGAAGMLAGTAVAAVHALSVWPLIQAAEAYEAHGDHAEAVSPLFRFAQSVAFDWLAGVAFALILAGAMTLRPGPIDPLRGLLWGAGGFLAFAMMPALGLPPELPGTAAADLSARQAWWLATAVATAAGLLIVTGRRQPRGIALGGVIIALPHLIGAPDGGVGGSTVPAELAARFAAASLGAAALFWAVLGGSIGRLFQRPV